VTRRRGYGDCLMGVDSKGTGMIRGIQVS